MCGIYTVGLLGCHRLSGAVIRRAEAVADLQVIK
jgi:hypothetical protein